MEPHLISLHLYSLFQIEIVRPNVVKYLNPESTLPDPGVPTLRSFVGHLENTDDDELVVLIESGEISARRTVRAKRALIELATLLLDLDPNTPLSDFAPEPIEVS